MYPMISFDAGGVALRKESVDRNNLLELSPWGAGGGRSPQGERG